MLDEETLEQLCANAQIVRYDLKSVSFSLEGVRIPSFIGKITIRMNGTKTMAGFANMLIEFGTFWNGIYPANKRKGIANAYRSTDKAGCWKSAA